MGFYSTDVLERGIIMEKQILIKSTHGLHASLAAKVVQAATKYNAVIELHYEDIIVDLKSLLSLISLAIPNGVNVKIIAKGDDAEKALLDISKILG